MNRFLTAIIIFLIASPAIAGEITITEGKAFPPLGAPTIAAYAAITNNSDRNDILLSASTPIATMTQLHTHSSDNGVMRMRALENVPIAKGQEVLFESGAHHFMIMGLTQDIKAGDSFPLMLEFEHAGKIETTIHVEKRF